MVEVLYVYYEMNLCTFSFSFVIVIYSTETVKVNQLVPLARQEEGILLNHIDEAKYMIKRKIQNAQKRLNGEAILIEKHLKNVGSELFKLRPLNKINDEKILNPLFYISCEMTHIFDELSKRKEQLKERIEKSQKLQETCSSLPSCQTQTDDIFDSIERIHRNIAETIKKLNEDFQFCLDNKIWIVRNEFFRMIASEEEIRQYSPKNSNSYSHLLIIWGIALLIQICVILYVDTTSIYRWFINKFR